MLLHPLPSSVWAEGKLAEVAEQVGKMMEDPELKSNQSRFVSECLTLYCTGMSGVRSPSLPQVHVEMDRRMDFFDLAEFRSQHI